MHPPILPTASSLLTPLIDAVVAARPRSVAHFNGGGVYAAVPTMYRAQLLVCLQRVAKEVKAARLRFAAGEELRTLCASEFETTLAPEPQTAIGTLTFSRIWTSGEALAAGVLAKKGDVYARKADPKATPLPIQAASYEAAQTVYAPAWGPFSSPQEQYVDVPIVARSPGAQGNIPTFYDGPTTDDQLHDRSVQPTAPLFDAGQVVPAAANLFSVYTAEASGGSAGLTDPVLVAAAKAYARGQFGPTEAATVASILRSQAARHTAILRASDAVPYDQAFVADESWASGAAFTNGIGRQTLLPRFTASVAQSFADDFQGFGCRVAFGAVGNEWIGLLATVALNATDDLTFTDEIQAAIVAAAQAYFDGRPDWYTWNPGALEQALAAADPRIQQVTGVTVYDATNGQTQVLTPPANPQIALAPTAYLRHLYLTDGNVTLTFTPPS